MKRLVELDRLNPIIVKELRQGNRSKAFLINFLLAQVAMLLFVVFALSRVADGEASHIMELDIGFWTILGFFLLIGVPLAGFNAINKERAEARLDLLHLTRLSALSIVAGKWLALVSQACLITLSIIPYVVSRYFYGGVNVVTDLVVVGVLLGFSALISGLSVSLSSFKSILIRIVLVGGFVWASGTVVLRSAVLLFRGSVFYSSSTEIFVVTLIQSFFFLVIALEFSASSISPLAENRQTRMRLWFLLQMAFLGALAFLVDMNLFLPVFGFSSFVGVLVLFCVLMFEPVPLSSIYRPFVKRGRISCFVGRYLLYPGFPSAVFFTLFCVSYFFVIFIYFATFRAPDVLKSSDYFYAYMQILLPTVLGCFFVPLAISLLFSKVRVSFENRFIVAVVALIVLGIVSLIVSHNYYASLSYYFAWNPFSSLFSIISHRPHEVNWLVYIFLSIASTVIAIYIALKRGSEWRAIERRLELEAADLLIREKSELAEAR